MNIDLNEAAPCPVITFEHSARQFVPPMARVMPGTIPSLKLLKVTRRFSAAKEVQREATMKRTLLTSAAILLLTGGSIAIAQDRGSAGGAGGQQMQQHGQGSSGSMQPSSPGAKGGADMKGGAAAEKPGGATTGQGSAETPRATQEKPASKSGAQEDKAAPKGSAADQKSGTQQKGASDTKSGQTPAAADSKQQSTTTGQGAAGTSASLTPEQRSKVTTSIKQTNVKAETNVNFNISVGTVVPRTVVLHELPATVIEVHPQWRGYRFILVGGEIIIIEPATYKIVTIISA
jgi:hypothetical protein